MNPQLDILPPLIKKLFEELTMVSSLYLIHSENNFSVTTLLDCSHT